MWIVIKGYKGFTGVKIYMIDHDDNRFFTKEIDANVYKNDMEHNFSYDEKQDHIFYEVSFIK